MSSDEQVRQVWTAGSYPDVGRNFLPMAAHLVEDVGVTADDEVLDVACGTGNAAITAARRGASVVGLDLTPAMLEDARANARLAGVDAVAWREGDAADLPFADDRFDVTLSCVGHMFATPPEDAASELLRVTRPGGRIGFTSWTPGSVVPAMARVRADYLPAGAGPDEPPFAWGDPAVVRDRLGDGVTELDFETGSVDHFVVSPAHYWDDVRSLSGLFIVALEQIDEAEHAAVDADMVEAVTPYFDGTRNAVPMEYRLATATVA